MAGFGKREGVPTSVFLEVPPSKAARRSTAPAPRALEVPSIGTAKTIRAALVYFTIFFGCLGVACVLLFVEHPLSLATPLIQFLGGLFE
jgi:hypothetical protein